MIKKCDMCEKEFTDGVDGYSYKILEGEKNYCCDCGMLIAKFFNEAISNGALYVQYGNLRSRVEGNDD